MTALMPTRTHNKELLALGKRISISQTDEIKFMKQWLEDRGKDVPMDHGKGHMNMPGMMDMASMPMMPGMLTPEQMKALAKATGPTFDHLFLTGMIQHHTGALVMVQDLSQRRRLARMASCSTSPPMWIIHSARKSKSCRACSRRKNDRNDSLRAFVAGAVFRGAVRGAGQSGGDVESTLAGRTIRAWD